MIHILETNSVKHVPIESFSDRIQCEHALRARSSFYRLCEKVVEAYGSKSTLVIEKDAKGSNYT